MATKRWGETKAPKTGSLDEIRRLSVKDLKPKESFRIRLVGDVLPNYVHWISTNNGWRTRNACNFNRDLEDFDPDIDNPIERLVVPQMERAACQFAYVTNVINREDGQVYLFELKQSIYKQIVDYASKTDEFGDPSNPDSGYDFTVEKISTGPKKQNVKYQLYPTRNNTPLTDEEKDLKLYDLEKLHKQETPDEQITWLRENTQFLAIEVGSDVPSDQTSSDDVPF